MISRDHHQRTAKAIDWIKANCAKSIKVEDLAQFAGMSVSTFHHYFRVLTAMSPLQYHKRLRLQATRGYYMRIFNFPGYAAHKSEHESFIAKVLDFEERFKSGKLLLTPEITRFVRDWAPNHIVITDKKCSDFLIKNGVMLLPGGVETFFTNRQASSQPFGVNPRFF